MRFFPLLLVTAVLLTGCSDDEGIPVVTISGQNLILLAGQSQLTAVTTNGSDGSYVWESSDVNVATVDNAGLVSGLAPGQCDITARGTGTGYTGTYLVTVSPDPNTEIPNFAKWRDSPHNDVTAEAFTHWDEDGEVPSRCAKCHTTTGYLEFLGDDGSTPGDVSNPHAIGQTVECVACHNTTAMFKTTVEFPSGVVVGGLGPEQNCMECHQGRASKEDVDDTIGTTPEDDRLPDDDQGFINVHYFPAASTRYGGHVKTGYMYDGMEYDVLFAHVPGLENCQECHDAHTQQIRVNVCAQCHAGVASTADLHDIRMKSSATRDYDGDGNLTEGLYFELDTLRGMLLTAIKAYAEEVITKKICYDSHSYPYWFNDTDGDGNCSEGEANYGNQFKDFTPRLLKATFNYQFAVKDPGGFTHNGKFIIQLLHDSIADLNASAMTTKVDLSEADRNDQGHFDGTVDAFRHWDLGKPRQNGTVSASCARCHSASPGFDEYLTYESNTPQEPSNGFDCATCHTTFDTFETKRIETVTFVSGYVFEPDNIDTRPDNDPEVISNICMTCHQGRTGKKQIDEAIAKNDLKFLNIHYLAAGATLMGAQATMGYEYKGSDQYSDRFRHGPSNSNNCVYCHVRGVPNAGNPTIDQTEHTFLPQDNVTKCVGCHTLVNNDVNSIREPATATGKHTADYDGDGLDGVTQGGPDWESLHDEIETMAQVLIDAMDARSRANNPGPPSIGIVYDAHRYPYFFRTDTMTTYDLWDEELVKAAHNYQQAVREPGAWAHNFEYIGQLLYDSIEDITGAQPKNPATDKDMIRPALTKNP
ncbi:MAG: Ig-like domain-containing protein [Planctomycetota bacterium]|jgi:hypothetical protein